MALDEPKNDEQTTPVNGVDVLIDDKTKPFTSGNVVDYIDSTAGKGFIIRPDEDKGKSCC